MDQQKLLKLIKQNKHDRFVKLDLSFDRTKNPHITERIPKLPDSIGDLTHLTELHLSHNRLETLPPSLEKLIKLQALYLDGNNLSSIPNFIFDLPNLQILDLGSNNISVIPNRIANLQKLRRLYLYNNQLKDLPETIFDLTNLELLDLANNNLIELLIEIGNLTNLVELQINYNKLTSVPNSISNLKQLQVLSISSNSLVTLPSEIGELSSLITLYLNDNYLDTLPRTIAKLVNLKQLHLGKNRLNYPPEIINNVDNPSHILAYITDLQQSEATVETEKGRKAEQIKASPHPFTEARVVIIGAHNVGKSSLLNKLLRLSNNGRNNRSEGVVIRPLEMTIRGQRVQVNLWDFGYQDLSQVTHQFFLTERSLYLLVLDNQKDEHDNRLHYWLKMIKTFCGISPVIIVGNKFDEKPLHIAKKALQESYRNIEGFVETSCLDNNETGIDELKEIIVRQLSHMDHIFDPMPASWFLIKEKIESITDDYILLDDFYNLCDDMNLTNRSSQDSLLQFLHDLGIVLYFPDIDDIDRIILNPAWITTAVDRLLNNTRLSLDNNGILTPTLLKQTFKDTQYDDKRHHRVIIRIMQKFEWCHIFPHERKYLLPDLLPKDSRHNEDFSNTLKFELHFTDVLPTSVISRFIVRNYHRLFQETVWRTGAILILDNVIALVRADYEEHKIYIDVKGDNLQERRHLLTVIREEFRTIKKTFPDLEYHEKIQIPEHPHVVVNYDHVVFLEKQGVQEQFFDGLEEKYPVKKLLEGVESIEFDTLSETIPTPKEPPTDKPNPEILIPVMTRAFYGAVVLLAVVAFIAKEIDNDERFLLIFVTVFAILLLSFIFAALIAGALSQSNFLTVLGMLFGGIISHIVDSISSIISGIVNFATGLRQPNDKKSVNHETDDNTRPN